MGDESRNSRDRQTQENLRPHFMKQHPTCSCYLVNYAVWPYNFLGLSCPRTCNAPLAYYIIYLYKLNYRNSFVQFSLENSKKNIPDNFIYVAEKNYAHVGVRHSQ